MHCNHGLKSDVPVGRVSSEQGYAAVVGGSNDALDKAFISLLVDRGELAGHIFSNFSDRARSTNSRISMQKDMGMCIYQAGKHHFAS